MEGVEVVKAEAEVVEAAVVVVDAEAVVVVGSVDACGRFSTGLVFFTFLGARFRLVHRLTHVLADLCFLVGNFQPLL